MGMAHASVLGRGGSWATALAVIVQLSTAGGIALHSLSAERSLDGGWGSVAILVVLATPALLAAVGMAVHPAGLLAAAVATGALAVMPVSLHSLTFLPVACVYLAVFVRHRRRGERAAWASA